MEGMGKRYIYIIASTSNYDGLNCNVWFSTRNKQEAISRFKWLYEHWIRADYTNDEGEVFAENNYSITPQTNDPNYISGYFYYYDDEGECNYILKSIKTDHFFGWGSEPNNRAEENYNRYLEGEDN